MKKLLMVVNPRAGRNKSRGPLYDAAAILSQSGYLLSIHNTAAAGDACEQILRRGGEYDLIAAAGGDGTLNEAASALLEMDNPPPLGYLPQGSTNDFAASLHIPADPAKAAAMIAAGHIRRLDAGLWKATYPAGDAVQTKHGDTPQEQRGNTVQQQRGNTVQQQRGNTVQQQRGDTVQTRRHFVYVASFGAFTRTSYSAQQSAKNALGHFAYILEGMRDLESLRPYAIRLNADGECLDGEYLFGAVCNSTSIGGLMKLDREHVILDDGLFELLLIPNPRSPLDLQNLMTALVNQEYSSLIFRHISRLHLETEEELPWSLDGEYAPSAPVVEIENRQQALAMVLPERDAS